MSEESTSEITASCHCKMQQFTAAFPTSALPIVAKMCHCDSCRRVSGCLHTSSAAWPTPIPVDHKLASYDFSKELKIYFCPKCSQKMFWQISGHALPLVITASLPGSKGLVDWAYHIFVADTVDGGSSTWLKSPSGKLLPRWAGFAAKSDKLADDWPSSSLIRDEMDLAGGDTLPIRCHCGGVNLRLSRPDYSSNTEAPWNVEPTTKRKWMASMCPCDSCRLTFSCDLTPFAFVDLNKIETATDGASSFPSDAFELSKAVERGDASIGTLSKYQSSKEAFRFACRKCSASVFYACDSRPSLVDVAVGLIDSPDGARAEGMLWWKKSKSRPLSHIEDVKDTWREELCQNFTKDWLAYREQRGWVTPP